MSDLVSPGDGLLDDVEVVPGQLGLARGDENT